MNPTDEYVDQKKLPTTKINFKKKKYFPIMALKMAAILMGKTQYPRTQTD